MAKTTKTTSSTAISVVVPTYNEAANVVPLVKRIAKTMKQAGITYEVVFIDDRSDDSTPDIIRSLKKSYPVRVYTKQGTKGKAYSLIEGFAKAKYQLICMIDGDLQYPPEAIPGMSTLLSREEADIIQTRRVDNNTSRLRKLSTKTFNFVFAQMLFGIKFDTQSGLKLFKKEILTKVDLQPGAWTFDLDFLVKSMQHGYKVVSYDIVFSERLHGEAKISVFTAASEMAIDSVKLKYKTSRFSRLPSGNKLEKVGARNLVIGAVVVAATVLGVSGNAHAASLNTSNAISNLQQTVNSVFSVAPSPKPASHVSEASSLPATTATTTTTPAVPPTSTKEAVPAGSSTSPLQPATGNSTPTSITVPFNDNAYHSAPVSGNGAYNNQAALLAAKRGKQLAHIGGYILKIAILVMVVSATLYAVVKSKQRTGKLAIQ
jgi:glycosyltransferase involved in cell wall biosynthesis